MSVRKKLDRYSSIAGVKSATSRKWTPSAASCGRSDSFQQRDRLPIIVSARPRMAISCCSVFRPSGERSSMPARYFFSSVASRTMKNSSRLVPLMPRNLTRSSSGCAVSHAWASTRWLNSSHENSRLRYSAGFEGRPGRRRASRAAGRPARSSCAVGADGPSRSCLRVGRRRRRRVGRRRGAGSSLYRARAGQPSRAV